MTRWPGNASAEKTTFGVLSRSELMVRVRSFGNKSTEGKMVELLRAARITGRRRHLSIAGKPDFSWPKERVAVFLHGCFWHGHTCGKNVTPKTNEEFWQRKIRLNRRRDRRVTRQLIAEGWKVLRIWECWLQRKPAACLQKLRALRAQGSSRVADIGSPGT